MPARTKLSDTAGPAAVAAAVPVSTKIPAPIMAPMPSVIKFSAPSDRLSVCAPVSLASWFNVDRALMRKSLDMYEGLPPQESVTDSLQLERILPFGETRRDKQGYLAGQAPGPARSEERRVGKACRSQRAQ